MLTSEQLTYGTAGIAASLMAYGIVELIFSLKSSRSKRIERRLTANWGKTKPRDKKRAESLIRNLRDEHRWLLARLLSKSTPGLSFKRLCYQADIPWPAHHVLVFISFLSFSMLSIGLILQWPIAITMIWAGVIAAVPYLGISMRRTTRMKKFGNQLPEVLELISQSLRAGHTLPSGIQLVAEQLPDPAGSEFARIRAEQDLGVRLEDALVNMSERIELLDLKMIVTAMSIQRQTGGDLTEIMDRIGAVIRDRIRILGQVKALTAESRLGGVILILLPILTSLTLYHIQPDHIGLLFTHEMGQKLLIIASIMMVLGIVTIRKIVNFKV